MASLFNSVASMVAGLVVILVTTPPVLLALPVVGVAYYVVQDWYRASSREVRRLQSIARSPTIQHMTEVLEGLTTVRAFRAQAYLTKVAVERMDRQCRCMRAGNALNRWLDVRMNALGALVVLAVGATGAVQAAFTSGGADAALLGLALTYAFQVTGYLNGFMTSVAATEMGLVAMERLQVRTRGGERGGGGGMAPPPPPPPPPWPRSVTLHR